MDPDAFPLSTDSGYLKRPLIRAHVAKRLRACNLTWKEISEMMKRNGEPPDPFPAFSPMAIGKAVSKLRSRK